MSIDFNAWVSANQGSSLRTAEDVWALIQLKPVGITIHRGAMDIAEQTVRVTFSNAERVIKGESSAMSAYRDAVVFGVKGHPTVTDTDIKRGDEFTVYGRGLKVIDMIEVAGGIQAFCEAVS